MYNVELAEHAWLNITQEDIKDIGSPLRRASEKGQGQSTPSYFAYNEEPGVFSSGPSKKIMNIELLPEQVVIPAGAVDKSFPYVYRQSWIW